MWYSQIAREKRFQQGMSIQQFFFQNWKKKIKSFQATKAKGFPHHQYSCLENPMNSMKRQNDRIPKEELPRSLGALYANGDQWRNNSRKNEETEPKQKQYPVVDVTGDRSKIRYCKEQYCIGTWNVRSMNQGKLKWSNRRWQEWTSTIQESAN